MDQSPPQQVFKAAGIAILKNVNLRKELHGDERILAVDLKLSFKSQPRELGYFFEDAMAEFLWRMEEKVLSVRNIFLQPLEFDVTLDNCTLKVGEFLFSGCTVKKFCIESLNGGRIKLDCQAIIHPDSNMEKEMHKLAQLIQEEVQVTIQGAPDLFRDDS